MNPDTSRKAPPMAEVNALVAELRLAVTRDQYCSGTTISHRTAVGLLDLLAHQAARLEEVTRDRDSWRRVAERLETEKAALTAAGAEKERLRADKARLDFLDECNAALNGRYGTSYGWTLVLSHNVTRLMLGRWMEVDLHDSEGSNARLPSCRDAIDRESNRLGIARRAALSPETRLCPHAPTYDAGLCCGHPDDCTFVSPSAALSPKKEQTDV
jgi:hypothetical protein